jgi:hypothetical protein
LLDPELNRYRPYWEIRPIKTFKDAVGPYREIYTKPVLTHNALSFSNYLLWRFNEEIDRLGIEGVYFDHGPPHDSRNQQNGGWIDSNGKLQPSLDILGLREFIKRLRVLFHLKGKAGYIFIHNSNREIVPAYTFAYATVDGEQYRNRRVKNGDYLQAITIDEFRTRFSPDQYGILCVWLPVEWTQHKGDRNWRGSEKQRLAYRRVMALALLHDVADWPKGAHPEERRQLISVMDEFGIDKANFIGYWDPRIEISTDISGIKVSAYFRQENGAYLFIVSNTTDEPQTPSLSFNFPQLGLKTPVAELLVEKNGEREIYSKAPSLSLTIPSKDFRWILLKIN